MRRNNQGGFFVIILVAALSLAVVPMIFMITRSLTHISQIKFKYDSFGRSEVLYNQISRILSSYESCTNTFDCNNNSCTKNTTSIEVSKIKNFKNETVFDSNKISIDQDLHFQKAVIKIKNLTLVRNPFQGRDLYASIQSDLLIEIFSEGSISTQSKILPIYLEVDEDNRLIRCSTSKPALNLLTCEPLDVTKTCCRYNYTFKLPKGSHVFSEDEAGNPLSDVYSLQTSPISETHVFYPNREYRAAGDYGYKCLPSSSDSNCKDVQYDCEDSYTRVGLKAHCYNSYWDYELSCID